jgi:antitoxin PrlF
MKAIEETSTITATGQTTVPKAVRQALGVDYGGKIAFRIERGRVTVRNPEAEHRDPVLAAFLALLEKDIAAGRNVGDLPPRLLTEMRRAMREVPVDLDEPLEASPESDGTRRRRSAPLRARVPAKRRRGRK